MAGNLMTVAPYPDRVRRFMRRYSMPYLFIAVPVLSIIVFLFIPMIASFWWSLNDFSGIQAATFVGMKNYIQLFSADPIFIKTLLNTTLFVLMGMGIGPSLGMLTALLLNQKVRLPVCLPHRLLPAGHDLAGGCFHHLGHALQPERPA